MMDYISEDDDQPKSDEGFTPVEIHAMLRRYDDDAARRDRHMRREALIECLLLGAMAGALVAFLLVFFRVI